MKGQWLTSTGFATALRRFVVAGVASQVGFAFAASAAAEDLAAAPGVSVNESEFQPAINLEFSQRQAANGEHFNIAPARASVGAVQGPRRFGYVLNASGGAIGVPVDLSVSQHVTVDENQDGTPERQGRGAEIRLGGVIADLRGGSGQGEGDTVWYMFAASDDEAVTWRPGAKRDMGANFALQDHVEIGDMQAGVTVETRGVQASLAYVEREVSTRLGNQGYSQDESFAGLTVTMRR